MPLNHWKPAWTLQTGKLLNCHAITLMSMQTHAHPMSTSVRNSASPDNILSLMAVINHGSTRKWGYWGEGRRRLTGVETRMFTPKPNTNSAKPSNMLWRCIRVEQHVGDRNIRAVWKGLQSATGYKKSPPLPLPTQIYQISSMCSAQGLKLHAGPTPA